MGIAYRYVPASEAMLVVWGGPVSLADWQEHLERLFSDARYAKARVQLTDIRFGRLDESIKDESVTQTFRDLIGRRQVTAGKKLAIVAGQNWSRAKVVELAADPLRIKPIVFNDVAPAALWLGLQPRQISTILDQIRQELGKRA